MRSTIPPQHATNQRCMQCPTILSRYNPYQICGPCRVKIAGHIEDTEIKLAEDLEDCGFTWERFPKREVVRRGPLLSAEGTVPLPFSVSEADEAA